MCDHEYGPALGQPTERFLDQRLGFGVDRRGGLVEHQQRRVGEDRARQRDALELAARQALSALAHVGVEAVRQSHDEVISIRGPSGGQYLVVRGVGVAIADVVEDGAREQDRLLGHDADLSTQRVDVDLLQVLPVDGDAPGVRGEEAQQVAHERGLAGPIGAHERDRLATLHVERDMVEDGLPLTVGERDVLEGHLALADAERRPPRLLLEGRRLVEEVENTIERDARRLIRLVGASETAQRREQHGREPVERHQAALGHDPGEHLAATHPQHHGRTERHRGVRDTIQDATPTRLLDQSIPQPARLAFYATALGLFLRERLHDRGTRDLLLQVPRQGRTFAARVAPALAESRVQGQERGGIDRHRHEHDERQLPVDHEDGDEDRDDGDGIHERLQVTIGDHVEHGVDVAHQA